MFLFGAAGRYVRDDGVRGDELGHYAAASLTARL